MPFRVEYSEEAKYDLDLILEWLLAREAGETGLRWFRNFKDAIPSLAEFPRRCPQAPEVAEFLLKFARWSMDASPTITECCLRSTVTL